MATILHVTHDDGRGDMLRRQWTNSHAECMQCEEKWIATHPLACGDLACPRCSSFDTIRTDD